MEDVMIRSNLLLIYMNDLELLEVTITLSIESQLKMVISNNILLLVCISAL